MDEQLSISRKINWRGKTLILIIGIILMAMTLRLPLTVVGPIIEFIREGLGISNVLAGFLTTIPLLAFALVSPFVPRISRTIGIELSLFISMLLLATGIALRSAGITSLLLVGTIIIGVAISFGNVLLPSFFKLKFPFHVGLMMGIYSVAMNVSGGFGAGLSHPIANTTNWQFALAFPIVIVLIASLVWSPQLRNNDRMQATATTAPKLKLWRSPLAWAVTLAMGLQSFIFYTTGAWLPAIFVSQGMAADKAGWMVAIMLLAQLPLTFIMPVLADKLKNQRPIVVILTLLYTVGFVGIALGLTEYTVLWMICIGSAGGSSFSLAMMLFTLRTKTAYAAADLSGFAQSIGYLLAASGPIVFGALYDYTGSWQLPIYVFLIVVAILFVSGWYAAGNKYIEEQ
ncbi:CynX/NimT family MFS transporter [Metalysinibacillus jejuensis]|uniref:CynX/NimT family MFS transporter n=1 Tax=Metalysinibacillus jejuensis TaxID=914327 RepID=UPI000D38E6AA|nr:MFS transporter [Metalysinibacillus jejuensis]